MELAHTGFTIGYRSIHVDMIAIKMRYRAREIFLGLLLCLHELHERSFSRSFSSLAFSPSPPPLERKKTGKTGKPELLVISVSRVARLADRHLYTAISGNPAWEGTSCSEVGTKENLMWARTNPPLNIHAHHHTVPSDKIRDNKNYLCKTLNTSFSNVKKYLVPFKD